MDQITSEIDTEVVNQNGISTYLECFKLSNEKFNCLVAGCKSSLANKQSAIKHLKRAHANVHEAVGCVKSMQSNKSCEVKIIESPEKIWHAILQIIIFCALPFSIVHEWGFKLLIKPYVTAFRTTNSNFSVGRVALRSKISEQAQQIKDIITAELKGKMVCLLLDIASRHNRSVLGISIVFYGDGKVKTRTIGMVMLKISQTAQNLFDIVKKKLNEFEVNLNQVFAVTTDNGKNFLKLVKIFRHEVGDLNMPMHSNESSDEENDDDEPNGMYIVGNEADDEIFDPENFNDEYFRDLLTNLRSEFSSSSCYTGLFTGISCAVHCLHLVVMGAIKSSSDLNNLIDKCRTLVKKLRAPNMRGELRKKSQKMAVLDVETRWSSFFDMVCIKSSFQHRFKFDVCV